MFRCEMCFYCIFIQLQYIYIYMMHLLTGRRPFFPGANAYILIII